MRCDSAVRHEETSPQCLVPHPPTSCNQRHAICCSALKSVRSLQESQANTPTAFNKFNIICKHVLLVNRWVIAWCKRWLFVTCFGGEPWKRVRSVVLRTRDRPNGTLTAVPFIAEKRLSLLLKATNISPYRFWWESLAYWRQFALKITLISISNQWFTKKSKQEKSLM